MMCQNVYDEETNWNVDIIIGDVDDITRASASAADDS